MVSLIENINNFFKKKTPLIIHLIATIFPIIGFIFLTYEFKPTPLSDFLYYWDYSTNLGIYIKGGFLFLLYAPLKIAGITPYTSALLINSLCFILLAYMLWIENNFKKQILPSFCVLLIGIWFLAFSPIVNADIPAITFFLIGLRLFHKYYRTNQKLFFILACSSFILSFTIKIQFLLIAFLVFIIIFLYTVFFAKRNKVQKDILFLLGIAFFISFFSCKLLEKHSNNIEGLEQHQRVTFYTGLIETSDSGISCGGWNLKGVEKEKAERATPLFKAVGNGIKEKNKKQLIQTILCKWDNYIFNYNQSGVGWLKGLITENIEREKFLLFLDTIEGISIKFIKLIATLLVFFFIYQWKNKKLKEKLIFIYLLFNLLAFFGIHTILESQPRYLLSPILMSLYIMIYLQFYKTKEIK